MNSLGKITGISGPVVKVSTDSTIQMFEVAHVGSEKLIGEVIRIQGQDIFIQVYEDTSGLCAGEPVVFTGSLLKVQLGPGLLGSVLDGIGRPLVRLGEDSIFLQKGDHSSPLDPARKWKFEPDLQIGDKVIPGSVIGKIWETPFLPNMVMVPPDIPSGTIDQIMPAGEYTVSDDLCILSDGSAIKASHGWEVRRARPVSDRLPFDHPLITGQRILDTLFPMALGGAAVLPGGFGTGKTVTQQSLAKWCNADVIVYIGCGERGNEMTEVLEEFPSLSDPYHDVSLMERMVLIANTSNMPVAAREASIYLGMTVAEYYRDMGYNVAIMADSTSRWAEALREIGGRLEEMPGEEGYPAYLGSRLAQYYERAGRVNVSGEPARSGSVSIINAVSPAGGDFSEPVTQSSLRLSGVFWGLDKRLAQQRHFPAINWQQSYTLFEKSLTPYFTSRLGEEWTRLKDFLREMMERERVLKDLVQLVGRDGLSEKDKWILELAEMIRVIYLQQNAFSESDAFCPLEKQKQILTLIQKLDELIRAKIDDGLVFDQLSSIPLRLDLLKLRELEPEVFDDKSDFWLDKLKHQIQDMVVFKS